MAERRAALAGIRVIDLSHQAAGPWCTSFLGDLGADVVKVEKPGRGDGIRYADRTGRLPPPPVADITTGIYAALGICAALVERDRSGTGQRVEVAMLDAVVSLFSDVAANVLTDGQRYGKFGSGHPDLVPYQAFPARDGYFIVACLTNAFWKRLCAAIGREDLLADPRFATHDLRVQHRAAIVPILSDLFRTRECEHWIALP